MKIAVFNSDGEQQTPEGMIAKYFLVTDSYDFVSNDAVDVSSYYVALVLETYGKIDYEAARECMKTKYKPSDVWSALSDDDKKFLLSHSVYPSGTTFPTLGISQEDADSYESSMLTRYRTSRAGRIEFWRKYIYRTFKTNTSAQFDIQGGIGDKDISYEKSEHPELLSWITGGVSPVTGINYSSTGLPSKTYNTELFQTASYNLIAHGIYPG